MGSRTRKATFLHYRLARPPTSVCRTSGLRSWTAGPSIVCLKTNQRPLWASGILLYLPTHRASEHRYLLLRGPVFLFDVTPQHIHRPRSPNGGMMSLAGRWERGAMPPGWLALYDSGLRRSRRPASKEESS